MLKPLLCFAFLLTAACRPPPPPVVVELDNFNQLRWNDLPISNYSDLRAAIRHGIRDQRYRDHTVTLRLGSSRTVRDYSRISQICREEGYYLFQIETDRENSGVYSGSINPPEPLWDVCNGAHWVEPGPSVETLFIDKGILSLRLENPSGTEAASPGMWIIIRASEPIDLLVKGIRISLAAGFEVIDITVLDDDEVWPGIHRR